MSTTLKKGDREESPVPENTRVNQTPSWGLVWEKHYPLVVATGAFVFSSTWPSSRLLNVEWGLAMIERVISASSIIVAYLLTATTIIRALEGKPVINKMKDWIHFKLLIRYFGIGIASSSFLLLLSFAAWPASGIAPDNYILDAFYSATWWAAFVFTVAAVFRVVRVFLKLLLAP